MQLQMATLTSHSKWMKSPLIVFTFVKPPVMRVPSDRSFHNPEAARVPFIAFSSFHQYPGCLSPRGGFTAIFSVMTACMNATDTSQIASFLVRPGECLLTARAKNTRSMEEAIETNGFYLGIEGTLRRGEDPKDLMNYQERIDALNAEVVSAMGARYINPKQYVNVTLLPEEEAAE